MSRIDELLLTDIAHNKDLLRAADGDLDKITGIENVKQALFRRMMTTPGSLVHRPLYGVGIKSWQNAPFSLDSQRSLAKKIQEQFQRDFRVNEVTSVRVIQDDDIPGKVVVFVKVKIIGLEETQMEFIPFGGTV